MDLAAQKPADPPGECVLEFDRWDALESVVAKTEKSKYMGKRCCWEFETPDLTVKSIAPSLGLCRVCYDAESWVYVFR